MTEDAYRELEGLRAHPAIRALLEAPETAAKESFEARLEVAGADARFPASFGERADEVRPGASSDRQASQRGRGHAGTKAAADGFSFNEKDADLLARLAGSGGGERRVGYRPAREEEAVDRSRESDAAAATEAVEEYVRSEAQPARESAGAAAIRAVLEAVQKSTFATNQEARRHFSALRVVLPKVGSQCVYWRCNAFGTLHSVPPGPNECTLPQQGGEFIYEEVTSHVEFDV